jgi:hypothetical protein
MQDIITIIKLMEQAPNFSTIFFGIFLYTLYNTIKSKCKDDVVKFIREEIQPLKDDVRIIKEKQKQIETKICSNGL